jgi:hypothetical protein
VSANTTVVIAAHSVSSDGELRYTAAAVSCAEELFNERTSFDKARETFCRQNQVWFYGSNGLARAKQLAALLADELREHGLLESEERPVIEFSGEGVYILSRKGKRKSVVVKRRSSTGMRRRGTPIPSAFNYPSS